MSITSVKFAGASMQFECSSAESDFGHSDGVRSYFFGHRAVIFMYRQDVRAVHVWTDKERTSASLSVHDCAGNEFSVHIAEGEDVYEVDESICKWRMAASERWEAESRARPVSRRSKVKAKTAAKKEADDDGDYF